MEISKRKNENELEEHEKPSTKRQRFKSGPANQKFLALYHELWPCLERSDKGDTFAKCTVSNSHFCCAHSGQYDCIRHIESKQHKDFIKLKQSSCSIANYCVENQTKTNLDMQIVKAEAITCENILNCVQSFLFVLAFRLRQLKMFDASYDGVHLSTQNYTYPHK